MTTKDDRPGLLSKVAMFVRNPTRDWTELEQSNEGDATGYDKQALKAMIERKRQNDFVRKREFDQLRKLRNRDPVALASMSRPSFFQTSLGGDLDGRAVTLKKIDEIEAQMSRQWWKAKGQDSQPPASTGQGPLSRPAGEPAKGDSAPYQGPSNLSMPFAATEPMIRQGESLDELNDFAPTTMSSGEAGAKASTFGSQESSDSSLSFSASALFAFDMEQMETDPDLEEAAIRYANGDDAGAEGGLLSALRSKDIARQSAQSWAAALLDFYRATGNQKGFESASQEFGRHFEGLVPVWVALRDSAAQGADGEDVAEEKIVKIWNAPAHLTAHSMDGLRAAMLSNPMPWNLGWGALQTIEPDAMPILDALFDDLCKESVSLHFDGHEHLVRAMRNLTPSGERQVDRTWWIARLNALRAMNLQEDFELAALDYCITFEVAPREWAPASCRVEVNIAEQPADFGARTDPADIDSAEEFGDRLLSGEILGDATAALEVLDSVPLQNDQMAINCTYLLRVDFAAAGGILNWVALRQSEGKHVQFLNVIRPVAAFLNVVGINEYAKVVPRAI